MPLPSSGAPYIFVLPAVLPLFVINSSPVELSPVSAFSTLNTTCLALLEPVSLICNLFAGEVSPIPTSPSLAITTLSVPPVLKSIWSSVSAVMDVSPSSSQINSTPFISILPPTGAVIVPTAFA